MVLYVIFRPNWMRWWIGSQWAEQMSRSTDGWCPRRLPGRRHSVYTLQTSPLCLLCCFVSQIPPQRLVAKKLATLANFSWRCLRSFRYIQYVNIKKRVSYWQRRLRSCRRCQCDVFLIAGEIWQIVYFHWSSHNWTQISARCPRCQTALLYQQHSVTYRWIPHMRRSASLAPDRRSKCQIY